MPLGFGGYGPWRDFEPTNPLNIPHALVMEKRRHEKRLKEDYLKDLPRNVERLRRGVRDFAAGRIAPDREHAFYGLLERHLDYRADSWKEDAVDLVLIAERAAKRHQIGLPDRLGDELLSRWTIDWMHEIELFPEAEQRGVVAYIKTGIENFPLASDRGKGETMEDFMKHVWKWVDTSKSESVVATSLTESSQQTP